MRRGGIHLFYGLGGKLQHVVGVKKECGLSKRKWQGCMDTYWLCLGTSVFSDRASVTEMCMHFVRNARCCMCAAFLLHWITVMSSEAK